MKHPILSFAIWTIGVLMLGVAVGARFFQRQELAITIATPALPDSASPAAISYVTTTADLVPTCASTGVVTWMNPHSTITYSHISAK